MTHGAASVSTDTPEASTGRPHSRDARVVFVALLAALLIVLFLAALPVLWIGSDDARMASILSSDEAWIAEGLRQMIDEVGIWYGIAVYPGGYLNTSLVVTLLLRLLGLDPERALVFGPRLMSLLGAVATAWLAALMVWRACRAVAPALLTAALVVTTTELARYSTTAHPDTLQCAYGLGCLLACQSYLEAGQRRHLWGAAVLAGLAFATKYVAGLVALLVGAVILWRVFVERRPGPLGVSARLFLRRGLQAAGVFFLAAAVSSPTLIWYFRPHWLGLREVSFRNSAGHRFKGDGLTLDWLWMLGNDDLLGAMLAVSALVALCVGTFWFVRQLRRAMRSADGAALQAVVVRWGPFVLLSVWSVLYLGLLVVTSKMFLPRYLLPAVVTLIMATVLVGWALLRVGLSAKVAEVMGAVLVVVALVAGTSSMAAVRDERVAIRQRSTFELGPWLEARVPDDTLILYDHYAYVPARFGRAQFTWGLRRSQLDEHRPALVITNRFVRDLYGNPQDASTWAFGAAEYLEIHEAYAALARGELADLRRVARLPDIDNTEVFANQALRARLGDDWTVPPLSPPSPSPITPEPP